MNHISFKFFIVLVCFGQMQAMQLPKRERMVISRTPGSDSKGEYIEYSRRAWNDRESTEHEYVTYYPKFKLYKVTGELVSEKGIPPKELTPADAKAFYEKVESEYYENEAEKRAENKRKKRIE